MILVHSEKEKLVEFNVVFFNLKNGVKVRKAVKTFTHQNPNLNVTFLRKMGWAIGIIQRNIKTEWIEAFFCFRLTFRFCMFKYAPPHFFKKNKRLDCLLSK